MSSGVVSATILIIDSALTEPGAGRPRNTLVAAAVEVSVALSSVVTASVHSAEIFGCSSEKLSSKSPSSLSTSTSLGFMPSTGRCSSVRSHDFTSSGLPAGCFFRSGTPRPPLPFVCPLSPALCEFDEEPAWSFCPASVSAPHPVSDVARARAARPENHIPERRADMNAVALLMTIRYGQAAFVTVRSKRSIWASMYVFACSGSTFARIIQTCRLPCDLHTISRSADPNRA